MRTASAATPGPSAPSARRRTPASASWASGVPVVVSWRSRVRPAAWAATTNTPVAPSGVVAGTRIALATSPAATLVLVPSSTQPPSLSGRAVVAGCSGSASGSTIAAVSTLLPAARPGRRAACCSGEPKRATGSPPQASAARAGTGAVRRPTSSSTRHSSSTPSPAPPWSAGTARPRSPPAAIAAHSARSNRWSPPSPPSPTSAVSSPSSRSSMARIASGIALSPSNLAATSAMACCSSVRSKSTSGLPSLGLSLGHGHAHAEGGEVVLGAEHLDGAGVGHIEGAPGGVPGHLPVGEPQELEAGVGLGEVELHPLLVDDSMPAAGQRGRPGPLDGLVEHLLGHPRAAQRDPLVVELAGDELPAVVLYGDQVGGGDADVVPVDGADVVRRQQAERRALDAGRVHRCDQDRDAAVATVVFAGADRQPAVVGVAGQAGPHLLAGDHVVVAVADGPSAQRRQVGAGAWLGVADAEMDLAPQDLRQEPP